MFAGNCSSVPPSKNIAWRVSINSTTTSCSMCLVAPGNTQGKHTRSGTIVQAGNSCNGVGRVKTPRAMHIYISTIQTYRLRTYIHGRAYTTYYVELSKIAVFVSCTPLRLEKARDEKYLDRGRGVVRAFFAVRWLQRRSCSSRKRASS